MFHNDWARLGVHVAKVREGYCYQSLVKLNFFNMFPASMNIDINNLTVFTPVNLQSYGVNTNLMQMQNPMLQQHQPTHSFIQLTPISMNINHSLNHIHQQQQESTQMIAQDSDDKKDSSGFEDKKKMLKQLFHSRYHKTTQQYIQVFISILSM